MSDDNLFHEDLIARLRRWVLALAFMVRPKRLNQVPRLAALTLEWKFKPEDARRRLLAASPDRELVAVVDDLSLETVLEAFRRGIYPTAHMGPMKWWSPDVRAVIDLQNTYIDQATRRIFRKGKWSITFNRDFESVVRGCAGPRTGRPPLTWLTTRMEWMFRELHQAGYAHSVEVWDENGQLAGGLFGVAIGAVYFGQSMFGNQRNASKVAIAALHRHLAHWGYAARDGRRMTPHLQSLGFVPMPRAEFNALVAQHIDRDINAPWALDPGVDLKNWPKNSA